ncbi:T9SS type A sorting domain-containing protein [Bacteroidota bacterium]
MSSFYQQKSVILSIIIFISSVLSLQAGEYPLTLTAYLGRTPIIDGYLSEGEYIDAEFITGVHGWSSDTDNGTACKDSLDLSVKVWYKHDGTYLYFAFDVTDNIIYGTDTDRWLPEANASANKLVLGERCWPWFGDGLEIMMNPSYTWNETKKSVGDGTIWQTICNTHKSYAGGLEYGGLIEGVPLNEYAWGNYQDWYTNEHMKAGVRIKTEEEGSGYIVEWRISPNPCMQVDENSFVDLSKESKVGINFEFEDLDNEEDGLGTSKNLAQFRHVDYMTKLPDYRKNIAKGFATLLITPEKMNIDILDAKISENYDSSSKLPSNYTLTTNSNNVISIQPGKCGNSNLEIKQGSPSEDCIAEIPFLWMDNLVYTSFDIIVEQPGNDICFELMAGENSAIKIAFEEDSIRYYQNGIGTGWNKYEGRNKYRIGIEANNQTKKYVLKVNDETVQDLGYSDSTGTAITSFRIQSLPATSPGRFLFDNLIIQEEPIADSAFYLFDYCWAMTYDFEESTELPANYQVTTESGSDISIVYISNCENNSLLFSDTSSIASVRLEVPIEDNSDDIHVQFTVDSKQVDGAIMFELRADEISLMRTGLNSAGKIVYFENEVPIELKDYDADTKYSFQIIANNNNQLYDLVVDSDTVKNISFYESPGTTIDNLSISSQESDIGEFFIDNLVITNEILSDLAYPFNACVETSARVNMVTERKGVITLYPNPTSGSVTIKLSIPHPNPIIVTDICGREIHRMKGTTEGNIEFELPPGVAPGFYLVNFKTINGAFSRRLQVIK